MSFILDQLKKSGKQRSLEMAMRRIAGKPEEKKAEPMMVTSAKRTPVSMHKWQIAAVTVLLGTVAVYGAVFFLRGTSPMSQPLVPVAKNLVQKASPLPEKPLPVSPVQIPDAPVQEEIVSNAKSPIVEQKKTEAAKAVKPVTANYKGRDTSEQAGVKRSTEKREKKLPAVNIDTPIGSESSGSVSADSFPVGSVSTSSVLEFRQLPQAVRKSLPEIRITSHLYRKDSRLVSINGRIMSEGYNMHDGLYLEEITPEGAILSYGKHRFLVRVER